MTKKQLLQLFMVLFFFNYNDKKEQKIDANSDGGVEWDEFMSYILSENQTLSLMKAEVIQILRCFFYLTLTIEI